MSSNPPVRFADHLRGANSLPRFDAADAPDAATPENGGTAAKSWEATDLSASDFADEVARRFHLPRIALPDLLAAQSLAKHFSRRFLRETMVFPFQSAQHSACLAVADPGGPRPGGPPNWCSAARSTWWWRLSRTLPPR